MRKRLRLLRHIFRFRGFRESLKLAAAGTGYLFIYHRNMRLIFMSLTKGSFFTCFSSWGAITIVL